MVASIILAYLPRTDWPEVSAFLDGQRVDRRRRLFEMVERLKQLGMPIDHDAVRARAEDAAGRSVGRPMLARALVAAGYVGSIAEAFDRFVEVFQSKVFYYSLLMCGQREDAEEVAQETLMKVFESLDQLREPQHVKALGRGPAVDLGLEAQGVAAREGLEIALASNRRTGQPGQPVLPGYVLGAGTCCADRGQRVAGAIQGAGRYAHPQR